MLNDPKGAFQEQNHLQELFEKGLLTHEKDEPKKNVHQTAPLVITKPKEQQRPPPVFM